MVFNEEGFQEWKRQTYKKVPYDKERSKALGRAKAKEANKFLNKGTARQTILKVLDQQGKVGNLKRDSGRTARLPGKRVSKSGKIYWETRKNRSDAPGKKI